MPKKVKTLFKKSIIEDPISRKVQVGGKGKKGLVGVEMGKKKKQSEFWRVLVSFETAERFKADSSFHMSETHRHKEGRREERDIENNSFKRILLVL